MSPKTKESILKNFRDHYDLFLINPEEVQEKACEKLKLDFDLSDDEAKNYYEMIKDEENNKVIREIENKVKVKVSSTDALEIVYKE